MRKEPVALLVLRLGLGIFLLLWSCDKFAEPETTAAIFRVFYKMPIPASGAYAVGGVEAIVSILIIAGAWKNYSYAAGLVLHAVSTIASWRQLASPFTQGHHLFVAAIPVLAAFAALYVLRDRDTLWAFDDLKP
ncbi:MAG: DoxX family membrane protein [Candidatus Binataceae bacterium]